MLAEEIVERLSVAMVSKIKESNAMDQPTVETTADSLAQLLAMPLVEPPLPPPLAIPQLLQLQPL